MDHRHPANRDDEVLPEPVASRQIDRAIELDAALRTGAPLAELRASRRNSDSLMRTLTLAITETPRT